MRSECWAELTPKSVFYRNSLFHCLNARISAATILAEVVRALRERDNMVGF